MFGRQVAGAALSRSNSRNGGRNRTGSDSSRGLRSHVHSPANSSVGSSDRDNSSTIHASSETTSLHRSISQRARHVTEVCSITLSDIDIVDEINFGTFGRVYRVKIKESVPEVVLGPELAAIRSRFFALKVMSKENIIRLQQLEHDERNHYMLMEHIEGGDMFERMRLLGAFSESVAKFYAAELVLALEHLHRQHIVHRDLKPENLMIDEDGHLKVIDFGFAKVVEDRTWTICGTPDYMAPEVVQHRGHSSAVDFWSLGVLIYEMVVGNAPFHSSDQRVTLDRIVQGHFLIPSRLSIELIDLLKKLLNRDLSERLGNLRNGVEDIKNHPWFREVNWVALMERRERGVLCRENMDRFIQARQRQQRLQQQQQQQQQRTRTNGTSAVSNSSASSTRRGVTTNPANNNNNNSNNNNRNHIPTPAASPGPSSSASVVSSVAHRSDYPSPSNTPLSQRATNMTVDCPSSPASNTNRSSRQLESPTIEETTPAPTPTSSVSRLLDRMDLEFPHSSEN